MSAIGYQVCKLGLLALYRALLDFEARGMENVPKRGPALLAANHASFLDPPALGIALARQVYFVARGTLADSKKLDIFMWLSDVIRIRRGEADSAAIRKVMQRLGEGGLVGLFPEGTRSLDGKLGEFEEGTILIARRAKVPIIPVGIAGTFEALPKGRGLRRHPIRVVYGKPFDASAGSRAEANQELRRRIGLLLEEAQSWKAV